MSAYYPCSVWSPTTKTNKVDLVDADHINQAQLEIVAIQNQLQVALDSDGSVISGTSFPSPAKPSSQFWRTDLGILYIFTGTAWSPQSGIVSYAAGNYKAVTRPTPVGTSNASTSYIKISEVYVPRSGTLRIKFWIAGSGGATGYGRIYRNGSAVGTEQSTTTTTGTQYSEDISGWAAGDLVQLYGKTSSGASPSVAGAMELFENAPAIELVDDSTYRISKIYTGDNAPTAITGLGSIGDMYMNTAGGASTTLYVKTGASTWTAK